MSAILKLDEEYRLIRAALVSAGVDMTDSMDALYRDWRRWRDKFETSGRSRERRSSKRGPMVGPSSCAISVLDRSTACCRAGRTST